MVATFKMGAATKEMAAGGPEVLICSKGVRIPSGLVWLDYYVDALGPSALVQHDRGLGKGGLQA
jgi:hypothetical protein